uniref:Uncharacterized protein n=1 Tax=Rhexinema sarcinoideum TaxID=43261 RepID=A0A1B2RYX4_9CHLO|nr:hypothetical protein [Rhexinema sarcinoideum]
MNTYKTFKLSTFNTSAKTKETVLKKRLNLVFQNCEMVFILADSKPHSQPYVKQFKNSFFQKVFFPKHVLNNFCLNIHMPIKGCHLDFLVYIENQENKTFSFSQTYHPKNFSGSFGCFLPPCFAFRSQNLRQKQKPKSLQDPFRVRDQYLKTHMLALLAEQIFKVEKSSPQFLMHDHFIANLPWQFNQLYGALVKNEENLFFYIGHAEIKQTLLLQQHLKQSVFTKSLLLPKVLMLQSFRKTFSNFEYLLFTHSQYHTLLLKNLTFLLTYLKFNLLSFIVLKLKQKI